MSFVEAVKTCLNKYATFKGRARRSELWWFVLFEFICMFCFGLLMGLCEGLFGNAENSAAGVAVSVGFIIVMLGLLLPSLAVGVRRLHDTGKSGWWLLIGLIPLVSYVGSIVLFVFYLFDSDADENEYGPSPKYQASEDESTSEQ